MTQSTDPVLPHAQRAPDPQGTPGQDAPSLSAVKATAEPETLPDSCGKTDGTDALHEEAPIPRPAKKKSSFLTDAAAFLRVIAAGLKRQFQLRKQTEQERWRLQQEQIRVEPETLQLKTARVQLSSARVAAFRSHATTVLLIIVVIGFISAICIEMNREIVVIEPFSVPPELVAQGYTSSVVANRIRDGMWKTLVDIRMFESKPEFKEERLDIQVPVGSISVRSLGTYLREIFTGPTPRLSGELTFIDKATPLMPRPKIRKEGEPSPCDDLGADRLIQLVLRYSDANQIITQKIPCPVAKLEALLEEGGWMAAYLKTPTSLAEQTYYDELNKNRTDFKRTLATIDRLLRYPPETDDAWALNLKGHILEAQNKPDEAIDSYQKAIEQDLNRA